jgi:hypothetical protein
MFKTEMGAVASFSISPITNIMEMGGSVLPKRFIEKSESQDGSIVSGDLGSISMPIFKPSTIVIPTNVIL